MECRVNKIKERKFRERKSLGAIVALLRLSPHDESRTERLQE
jgi:hypothetical protein